ncbi:MAG TPA: SDR family NAD(P)-dependent oxidoreductase, partial [Bacillaceae bacterium]
MNHNQVVVITGASKGLGRALALAFAEKGARLALCARHEGPLMDVKREAESAGAEVIASVADMGSPQDVDRFISVVEAGYGQIDVLINNASIFGPGPTLLADYPDSEFSHVLSANVM